MCGDDIFSLGNCFSNKKESKIEFATIHSLRYNKKGNFCPTILNPSLIIIDQAQTKQAKAQRHKDSSP